MVLYVSRLTPILTQFRPSLSSLTPLSLSVTLECEVYYYLDHYWQDTNAVCDIPTTSTHSLYYADLLYQKRALSLL